MGFIDNIKEKAKKVNKNIGFTEKDPRILKAIDVISREKIATPIFIGDKTEFLDTGKSLGLDLNNIRVLEPDDKYAKEFFDIRKGKISFEDAKDLSMQPNYYGTLALNEGLIDGLVSGALYATSETFRPAIHVIGTKDGIKTASTYFILIGNKEYIFADCALNIDPNEEQLADIAISTNDSAIEHGFNPKLAMLSFSTKGSASHEMVRKVSGATEIVKKKRPDVKVEGELQVDAAMIPKVAMHKAKDSEIQGDANIFIFPDLNSGNIGYKLVERFSDYKAIGPISQGFKKPVNDLSRGCSIEDIINVTAITVLQGDEK